MTVGKNISVGKVYSDRLLVVTVYPLKVDAKNVSRTKSFIHLPTDFGLLMTDFDSREFLFKLNSSNIIEEH